MKYMQEAAIGCDDQHWELVQLSGRFGWGSPPVKLLQSPQNVKKRIILLVTIHCQKLT